MRIWQSINQLPPEIVEEFKNSFSQRVFTLQEGQLQMDTLYTDTMSPQALQEARTFLMRQAYALLEPDSLDTVLKLLRPVGKGVPVGRVEEFFKAFDITEGMQVFPYPELVRPGARIPYLATVLYCHQRYELNKADYLFITHTYSLFYAGTLSSIDIISFFEFWDWLFTHAGVTELTELDKQEGHYVRTTQLLLWFLLYHTTVWNKLDSEYQSQLQETGSKSSEDFVRLATLAFSGWHDSEDIDTMLELPQDLLTELVDCEARSLQKILQQIRSGSYENQYDYSLFPIKLDYVS